jgi:hypothetical protein
LLGSYLPLESCLPSIFCFTFQIGLMLFYPGPASDHNPPTMLPAYWDYSCVLPCLARLLKWGLANFLPGLASNLDSPGLHLLSTWDYTPGSALVFWRQVLICSPGWTSPSDPHSSTSTFCMLGLQVYAPTPGATSICVYYIHLNL